MSTNCRKTLEKNRRRKTVIPMRYHKPKMNCLVEALIAIQGGDKMFCPTWLDSKYLPYMTHIAYEADEQKNHQVMKTNRDLS